MTRYRNLQPAECDARMERFNEEQANKYQIFRHKFTARHTDKTSGSVKLEIIVFCAVMFIVGFALGYYLSAAEAAHVALELAK